MYPACNAHAPVRVYKISSLYLINARLSKKVIECKVFRFSSQILSETFLILRTTERDMVKNIYLASYKVPIILVRFK